MVKNQCQLNFRMSNQEIKVPNIGDFENVEVIEVLVSEGQSISKNDPLITIESDKSSVEIPASYEGLVKLINIKSPSETLSPTFIFKDLILPSKLEGISTLDLSLSIVIKGSFFLRVWPSETRTSITSTSLKSPIFGTLISVFDIII